MSGHTGESCQESGVYKCSTHTSQTIPLAKGNRFPPCAENGGHAATWILKQKA
jgi:hypothetical protein